MDDDKAEERKQIQKTEEDDGSPSAEHFQLLRETFKHNEFRSQQWDIIRALIEEKRDVVAVMATGYGKSLCFQYPAVFLKGITLVVTPLIALMQDQLLSLEALGISACLLGTAQLAMGIMKRVTAGEFRLVYASPEYLSTSIGMKLLQNKKVLKQLRLIAIDEAHCVSQWGHDFRPDYRKLDAIRHFAPNVPILAVTATATERTRTDIAAVLNLNEPKYFVSSFDRSNLAFSIYEKTKKEKGRRHMFHDNYEYWKDLEPFLQNKDGSTIIYVLRKKEAENIAAILNAHNIVCTHYHADICIQERTEILRQFKNDEFKVIVATCAFGMGIDKRDVRFVIHYGAAKTLETYYQEVGRAGRDGHPSNAITFYSTEDFSIHDFFLAREQIESDVKDRTSDMQMQMRYFLYSTNCRRRQIIEHFGDDPRSIAPRPNCCDNCSQGRSVWPISDLSENVSDRKVSPTAVTPHEFIFNDEKFKLFLYEVRNKLASAYNASPDDVMKDAVVDRVALYKPSKMVKFKSQKYDDFNADKLLRYAPTIVHAIAKYKRGEFDMGFLLPNVSTSAPPHLLVKIQSGENVVDIAIEFQLTVEKTNKHAVELIKRGQAISLTHLKTFCGDKCDPDEVYYLLTDEDKSASIKSAVIVDRVHHQCPKASKIFIEVVLAYYQVRHHLNGLKVPYVDVADDTLVNGGLLIIPMTVEKRKREKDENDARPHKHEKLEPEPNGDEEPAASRVFAAPKTCSGSEQQQQ